MSKTAKIKAVRLCSEAVNFMVLLAVLLLLAFGGYAMWDSKQVYRAAAPTHYGIYKPTAESGDLSFQELRAINPEVFAWLTVYGTDIDYPIAQGPDNMKYINTNAKGQYSLSGAIFLDSGSPQDFSGFPSILYGHHMEKNAMFSEIGLFAEKSYFDAHRYGRIYFGGREHGLEFFAFVRADAYDGAVFRTNIAGQKARQAYLELLLSKAPHTRRVQVTAGDKIVLLSTCSASATNGRDILAAKLTDEIYKDPFRSDETGKKGNGLAVDRLPGLWARIPLWLRIAVLALPPLLLLAVLLAKKIRSRHKEMIRHA